MRYLQPDTENKTQEIVTVPVYLIYLGFSTPLSISSGPAIDWNGTAYSPMAVQVSEIASEVTGSQNINLQFSNENRQLGAIVLNEAARDKPVKIWLTYYRDGTKTEPILMAEGVMDGAEIKERVTISVISKSLWYGSSPRLVCRPPVYNNLPVSGSVLTWGNVTYKIVSR